MRKLATIQQISDIKPIPDADSVDVASVLGWKVVIRKGDFKTGDKCIYVEIDAVLPKKPEFQFLERTNYRIKTIRIRGQVSQGICFPTNILKDCPLEIGADVTELMGIEKYIPKIPANISGTIKGSFPSFIPKTDETRVQVLQDVLTRHKGTKCYVTEKVDGSSVTYYTKDGEFGVCSRNLELKEDDKNLLWKLAREQKIEEKLKSLGKNVAVQGEIIGIGVQGNNLRLDCNKVLFFNLFWIDKYEYTSFGEFIETMKKIELETVPIIETEYMLSDNIDEMVEKSKGMSKLNEKIFREGLVIRPLHEKIDMQLSQGFGNGRVSFKVINPDYLLKYVE